MRALPFASVLVGAIALFSASARADDDPPTTTTPRTVSHWYGWQTLIVDGAAIGLAFGSVAAPPAGFASIGTYALGGPIVHVVHDRAGIGAADLGIRVGAPLVFAITGAGIEMAMTTRHCTDWCGVEGAAVGAFVGYVFAVVIDAAVLAREQIRPEDADASSARTRRLVRLVPSLMLTKTGAIAGVGGTM